MISDEKGFALTDALIAAVIAAGVAVSSAQGLGVASRTARAANELDRIIIEAEIIDARLDAGIIGDLLLNGLPDWRKTEEPFSPATEIGQRIPYDARRIRIVHEASPPYSFDRIVIMGP
jgi:hypothetical protein